MNTSYKVTTGALLCVCVAYECNSKVTSGALFVCVAYEYKLQGNHRGTFVCVWPMNTTAR